MRWHHAPVYAYVCRHPTHKTVADAHGSEQLHNEYLRCIERTQMIEINNLTKTFDDIRAVNDVTFEIPDGVMYGILGTNGAGKSTLLRMMAGIIEPDAGEIRIDGILCYDNPVCKERFFYLSDTPYYFPNASMEVMTAFYQRQYQGMDLENVSGMAELLDLDMKRPIRTFSKGMKRQAFLIMALCANTRYLLCDEVFDGLDPVVTEVMKNLLRQEMKERKLTVVVVSHKLQDLEDICHHIGILHKGGILKAGDMREQAKNIHKYQCVFQKDSWSEEKQKAYLEEYLDIVRFRKEGHFVTLIVRENLKKVSVTEHRDHIGQVVEKLYPVFCQEVPMTLEEIFIAEMEESGYDIRKVLQ